MLRPRSGPTSRRLLGNTETCLLGVKKICVWDRYRSGCVRGASEQPCSWRGSCSRKRKPADRGESWRITRTGIKKKNKRTQLGGAFTTTLPVSVTPPTAPPPPPQTTPKTSLSRYLAATWIEFGQFSRASAMNADD